ncbi:aspartic proteinase CDR1 [Jatropha curcas]|uniref:aspartic proteinase CDR1 n=1 Tax=Jatropha curcas TaxID=180498 RepID=UPI0009D67683|nr:aspartic proteinase CDR1 [Jatropha curcas]
MFFVDPYRIQRFSPKTHSSKNVRVSGKNVIVSRSILMRISNGTPPFKIWGKVDTGSNLMWTQCKPCKTCYEQDDPFFDPINSSAYRNLSCTTKQCQILGESASCSITSITLPNFIMGRGHNNRGLFSPETSGTIGLGGSKPSIVSRLGDLKAISVGNKRIKFSSSSSTTEGNIIIDSGTALTFFPDASFSELATAFAAGVTGGKRVKDPSGFLPVCYNSTTESRIKNFQGLQFILGGPDVKLKRVNRFIRVAEGVICKPGGGDSAALYGNFAQMNFLVGYDLVKKTIPFKPTDCGKEEVT